MFREVQNPGPGWHREKSDYWRRKADSEGSGSAKYHEMTGRMLAHDASEQYSIRHRMNPAKQTAGKVFGGLGILLVPIVIGSLLWLNSRYGET